MRKWLSSFLASLWRKLNPPPQPDVRELMRENMRLRRNDLQARRREDYLERVSELAEARQMAGSGPWVIGPGTARATDELLAEAAQRFKESDGGNLDIRENLPANNGWWGELDLMLDTAEWRREINLSWLEFSRWGIQQIILISRLYWMKNPLIRRGVNIASVYVFGRNVDISSPDEAVNQVIKDFLEQNKSVFGHGALVDQERRKYYDGNLFWVFFADTANKGTVKVRTIDATEIQEIVANPEDTEEPWYYLREWTAQVLDETNGVASMKRMQEWYPALNYEPASKPTTIRGFTVNWGKPVHHRKVGSVSKWRFGCPIVYPALDWAKTAKRYLEACYTTAAAHAQIAWELTTKGGQQALAGMKAGMGTTSAAMPGSSIYDTNPTALNASVFASGPGTSMKPLTTRGAGGDPSEVKEYKNMVAICLGIPPTWLGDLETANLSTATTLDRPTELGFEEKQEEWREDITIMVQFAVKVSAGAASGKLREAGKKPYLIGGQMVKKHGRVTQEAQKTTANGTVEMAVNFPAIREGDLPELIKAVVEAMTLDNKGGLVTGIDEKQGVKILYRLLDVEDGDEIAEEMYPDATYEIDRTKVVEPDPIQRVLPQGGIQPTPAGAQAAAKAQAKTTA